MKTICTLEFINGRPVAKEVNERGTTPPDVFCFNRTDKECEELTVLWQQAENNRREFKISEAAIIYKDYDYIQILVPVYSSRKGFIFVGDRFTATIENNLVTKIELI